MVPERGDGDCVTGVDGAEKLLGLTLKLLEVRTDG
jgi:hypothetical protein